MAEQLLCRGAQSRLSPLFELRPTHSCVPSQYQVRLHNCENCRALIYAPRDADRYIRRSSRSPFTPVVASSKRLSRERQLLQTLEASLGDLTDGYALLGRFRIAAGKAGDGDATAAEGIYLEIASDSAVATIYRDAATLLSVMNAPESSNPSDLQSRLAPLAEGSGPWRPLALELSAALDLKAGDRAAASAKLQEIIELEGAPPELRQRAAQLARVLKS